MKLRRAEAGVNKRHGGGRMLRRGFWLVGAFRGAVGDKMGFNAAGELNGPSNRFSCGLRVIPASHAQATEGNEYPEMSLGLG